MATGKRSNPVYRKAANDYSLGRYNAELYFKQQVEQGLEPRKAGFILMTDKSMVLEWRKSGLVEGDLAAAISFETEIYIMIVEDSLLIH